jgi:hypothetical protein
MQGANNAAFGECFVQRPGLRQRIVWLKPDPRLNLSLTRVDPRDAAFDQRCGGQFARGDLIAQRYCAHLFNLAHVMPHL